MITTMIDEVTAFKMRAILLSIFESMMCHTMYELQLIKVRSIKDCMIQALITKLLQTYGLGNGIR